MIIGVVIVALYRLTVSPLAADAMRALDAIESSSPDALYDRALEDALVAEGLTRSKFRAVWNELIAPRLSRIRRADGSYTRSVGSTGQQAVAERPIILPNGTKRFLSVSVFETEKGGRLLVLRDMLFSVWIIDYMAGSRAALTSQTLAHAKLSGLRKDRPVLDRLGLTGAYVRPGYPFTTWDEMERVWSEIAAQKR